MGGKCAKSRLSIESIASVASIESVGFALFQIHLTPYDLRFTVWISDLGFVWNLVLGIWDLSPSNRNELKKPIRIGVVGIGHLGKYHLQKYASIPGCRIAGAADIDIARAREASAAYGCPPFSDHRELIGGVDAVSIAVPTESHFAIARDFLKAGVDILLEKPIAATMKEAGELVRLARLKKNVLQIGFVERFNPAIKALEKVIGIPMFIESHRLHPFFTRGTDVDVILDLMIHDLDIILHFVKSPIKSVEAVGVSVLSDKADIANARIVFASGCVANVTASRITGKKLQKIRFFGMEGYHSVDYEKRELVSLARKDGPAGRVEISPNTVQIEQCDPLEQEIRSFLRCVSERIPPLVTGEEAGRSLKLALQIARKMRLNQERILS